MVKKPKRPVTVRHLLGWKRELLQFRSTFGDCNPKLVVQRGAMSGPYVGVSEAEQIKATLCCRSTATSSRQTSTEWAGLSSWSDRDWLQSKTAKVAVILIIRRGP